MSVDADGRCKPKPKTAENRLENQRRYNKKMNAFPEYREKQKNMVVRWIKNEYKTNCVFREERKTYYREYYHKKKAEARARTAEETEQEVMEEQAVLPTGSWIVTF